jgi:ATP-binding cassette subfamily B protein/subfamily B ATP-binding cassette protein MsbA
MKDVLKVFNFYRQETPRIIGVILLMLIAIGLNLLKPWPMAKTIDLISNYKNIGITEVLKSILIFAFLTFILHVLHSGISAFYNYISIKVSLKGLQKVRSEIFSAIQRLSLKFHHGTTLGDLIYRASWDAYSIQTLFQQGFIASTSSVFSLIIMLIIMFKLDTKLALITMIYIPVLIISIRFFGTIMVKKGLEAQKADSQVINYVQQAIRVLPLIQSFVREDKEEERFLKHTEIAYKKRAAQHGWELLYWFGVSSSFGFIIALLLLEGAMEVVNYKISVGTLLVFIAYVGQLYEPLNQIAHVGSTVSVAMAGAKRVFEIIDSKEEVHEKPNAISIVRMTSKFDMSQISIGSESEKSDSMPQSSLQNRLYIKGAIEFDNVWFAYSDEKYVLREITFSVSPGERVAIIGPSGAGKTTLLNLIPRFYDPTKGQIKLDGIDLRDLKLKDLRREVSVVLQEPIIIPATVKENISYGFPEATMEMIHQAAKAANADVFIEKLPQKYNTIIGEGGVMLSVGECQRINLARAFLKNSMILLMDEPTASLDLESEAMVVKSIFELMKNRTTFIIAHRLETIRNVDKIISLIDGTIVEFGTPDELMKRNGYFKRIIQGNI